MVRLKLYQLTQDCSDPQSSACSSSKSPIFNCKTGTQTHTASSDGWVGIIVDSSEPSDGVEYTLTVKLDAATCSAAGCECP
jgi:hypothetical protein